MISLPGLYESHSGALVAGCIVFFVAGWSFLYAQLVKPKHRLPPGPQGELILGNLRQIPPERSDVQFANWAKEYNSDIIYLSVLGQPLIVLNSVNSCVDLLEKRGANYSDRPPFVQIESLGFSNNLALTPDGPQFRKLRKVIGNFLSARNSLLYRETQQKAAHELLDDLSRGPEAWKSHLSLFATRIIFSTTYGLHLESKDNPYFKLADHMGHIISNNGNNMGISVLDVFPSFAHLPYWLGRLFPSVKYVLDNRPFIHDFLDLPLEDLMARLKNGTADACFISRILEARAKKGGDEEEFIKKWTDADVRGTGGVLYSAGQDTTFSTLETFVLAMVLYPQVQAKAQKEIDMKTGGVRNPDFGDWESIPIIERIVSETLRFHPPLPNVVPHRSLKDDFYRDMYIPKGSMVIANAYAMGHDPEVYKDPFDFNPDRYIPIAEGGLGEPLPVAHFGFGRRICPGQYFGTASVWIAIASILANFDISKAKDKDGNAITPQPKFTTGFTSHAEPFQCVFTKRSNATSHM